LAGFSGRSSSLLLRKSTPIRQQTNEHLVRAGCASQYCAVWISDRYDRPLSLDYGDGRKGMFLRWIPQRQGCCVGSMLFRSDREASVHGTQTTSFHSICRCRDINKVKCPAATGDKFVPKSDDHITPGNLTHALPQTFSALVLSPQMDLSSRSVVLPSC
jgi:hypothetical protein